MSGANLSASGALQVTVRLRRVRFKTQHVAVSGAPDVGAERSVPPIERPVTQRVLKGPCLVLVIE